MTLSSLFGDAGAQSPTPASGHTGQTQSLYRKYRPQSFDADELVGQEHIVRTLRNAIQLNRVAHAYLFCGPRGTGKTTTARLLAKAVNCLDPDIGKRPCNTCANCVAITKNATPDVIEIDAASNRGIDDIRDLRERVKYAPTQLKTKVYIIDEAHQITGAAANAFLKTLEEPPSHSIFVLATTDPEELLQTIVSRCQRFDFRRIPVPSMIGRIRAVAEAEGLVVDDEALATIARHATGSLRDGLSLLDQLSVYTEAESDGPAKIDNAAVLALLGISRNERIEHIVTALADKDAGAALGAVNEAIEAGEDARQLNRQLVAYVRLLLHERAGGTPDADARAKELAGRFSLEELARLARVFSETDFKIRHSSYAQLPLEIALVEVIAGPAPASAPAQSQPAARTQDRPAPARQPARSSRGLSNEEEHFLSQPPTNALKDRIRGNAPPPLGVQRPVPAAASPAAPPTASTPQPEPTPSARQAPVAANPGELSVELLANLWDRVRADVKAVNRRAEALLSNVDPIDVRGGMITLGSTYEFHRNKLNEDANRRLIEETIGRLVGTSVSVTTVPRDDYVARPAAVSVVTTTTIAGEADDEAARRTAERDEQRIQAAKNIFDAEEIT